MSGGLILRLRPNEKLIINGAVLENGDRRAKLRVKTQNANILRMRDALHPSEATTPVKRAYYTAQLIVTGDYDAAEAAPGLLQALKDLYEALPDPECREHITRAVGHVHGAEYYQVMRALKLLLPFEEKLLLLAQSKSVKHERQAV